MDLENLVGQVAAVYASLDAQVAGFQEATALRCPAGCGKCCFKPDIEATVLEFLPFAYEIHRQGLAWQWLDRLSLDRVGLCPILDSGRPGAGLCSSYAHRGLICRLFGYSARLTKYGAKELVTCATIKTGQPAAFEVAGQQIAAGLPVPVMGDFYMRLHAIDADLCRPFFPVREAVRRAIETVLHHYTYRQEQPLPQQG